MALLFPSGLTYDTSRLDESGLFIAVDDLSVPRPVDTIVYLRSDKLLYRSVTSFLAIYEPITNLGGASPHLGEFSEKMRMPLEVPLEGKRWFALEKRLTWVTEVELKGVTWTPSEPDFSRSYDLVFDVSGVEKLRLAVPAGTANVLQSGLSVIIPAGADLSVYLSRSSGSGESWFTFSDLSLLLAER